MQLTRRELAGWIFLAAFGVFGLAAAAGLLWFALPQPERLSLGALDRFPPAGGPYVIRKGRPVLYLVNTAGGLLVFDSRSTARRRCMLRWVPVNDRFEDPCCGSKFSLTGEYLDGPARRAMDRYPAEVVNGQVWINLSRPTPGAPVMP